MENFFHPATLFILLAVLPQPCLFFGQTENMIRNGDFNQWENGRPTGWNFKYNRQEIAPGLAPVSRDAASNWCSLNSLDSGLSMGWLEQRVELDDRSDGRAEDSRKWLEFSCRVRLSGDQGPIENARVAIKWDRPPTKDKGWRPPRVFFVPLKSVSGEDALFKAEQLFPLIPGAPGLTFLLVQFGGRSGSVSFSRVKLQRVEAPAPRKVRVAAAFWLPQGRGDWQRNLRGIDNLAQQAAEKKCDLILFGEGVSVVGTGKSYIEAAQAIPGPYSKDLAAVARKYHLFLAAGLYERDGIAAYNTAVLFDRAGKLVGKYRKVHLPFPELYGGLQPGDHFPVFQTELGPIGLQVCYDHHFVESARNLALHGAKIILTPIWGDMRSDGAAYEIDARSRAIDNGVFYITSVYSNRRSLVVDPHGRILAETEGDQPSLAIADLDLFDCLEVDQPYRVPPNFQLGFPAERRPSAYGN